MEFFARGITMAFRKQKALDVGAFQISDFEVSTTCTGGKSLQAMHKTHKITGLVVKHPDSNLPGVSAYCMTW